MNTETKDDEMLFFCEHCMKDFYSSIGICPMCAAECHTVQYYHDLQINHFSKVERQRKLGQYWDTFRPSDQYEPILHELYLDDIVKLLKDELKGSKDHGERIIELLRANVVDYLSLDEEDEREEYEKWAIY